MDRRGFLKGGVKVAAAAAATRGLVGPAYGVVGANERIRIACVGLRWRGWDHVKYFTRLKGKGVDVPMLCDIDEQLLGGRAEELTKMRDGQKPVTHVDYRKVLEDKSIDAVSLGVPNHWHALGTIWACQAGKDVYVEKPVSWCIDEGRKMVEAARKHGRIVQAGLQRRSEPGNRKAAAEIRAGIVGDVYMTRALIFKRRESIGIKRPCEPPKHIHFDLWLGPAPKQPYHENLVHYNWHWFWDFGNGEIGNSGVHRLDLVRMTLGKELPVKVSSMGGRYGYTPPDQGQTPNTQVTTWTFEDGTMLVCDVRGRWTNPEPGVGGNIYYGSQGYLGGKDASFGYDGKAYGGKPAPEINTKCLGGTGNPNHFHNFIEAMRSRKVEDLNCDILEGHRSSVLAHMANISYRLGRTLTFDPKTERFVGDGAKEANAFVTREYRKPFVFDAAL
ncbi:MAG: Gfo/Idh/MocA family oxidoreductase [Phycisphaerae bacterium]|nr:Gfo/Idh/MocA family oxidoreductase [Phycisphaerae bacterium]